MQYQEDRFDRHPLNEITLARVASHVANRPFTTLTAFRFKDKETGQPISLQTNRANTQSWKMTFVLRGSVLKS